MKWKALSVLKSEFAGSHSGMLVVSQNRFESELRNTLKLGSLLTGSNPW